VGAEKRAAVKVTERVREEALRFFAPPQAEQVIEAFEATELPLIANNGERVCFAILLLSKGDITRFHQELRQARIDWRDTLVAARL